MDTVDTIAAICTGTGGAISIIRISGRDALNVGNRIWKGPAALSRANARKLILGTAEFPGQGGDKALAVYMPGPNSYTGEDIVEIQCHGGNLTTGRILKSALAGGARMAEPGEFTYRAFINDKMDLTQAEAVADVITAGSNMALNLAEKQVDGALGRVINGLYDSLVNVLAECESRMDFTEEELDWTGISELSGQLEAVAKKLNELLVSKTEGVILRNGIRVVIAGRPNAGKSSLLNLLLGYERAIVTQVPGTTRDTLEESATLRGIPVRLIDTAGIREADDLIEGMGIDRSRRSIRQAQIVLWLLDSAAENIEEELQEMRNHLTEENNVIVVWNKTDLALNANLPELKYPSVKVSVVNQENIESLLDAFESAVWGFPHDTEPELAVSARHAELLEQAVGNIAPAVDTISEQDWELAAVHLHGAIDALGHITGKTVSPDILDNIFSRFCIGK